MQRKSTSCQSTPSRDKPKQLHDFGRTGQDVRWRKTDYPGKAYRHPVRPVKPIMRVILSCYSSTGALFSTSQQRGGPTLRPVFADPKRRTWAEKNRKTSAVIVGNALLQFTGQGGEPSRSQICCGATHNAKTQRHQELDSAQQAPRAIADKITQCG